MVLWCYILASSLGLVIGTYLLLEIHYFIRVAFSVILAKYFKKRLRIMDTAIYTSLCITNDIDIYLNHMNNARYLRELDFARVDFYERTGLYDIIVSKNGTIVQGATTIRYRRFIRVFTIFQIQSRIVYWDEQSIFLEHRFVNPKDGFIHCIAVCKQRLIDCSANDVMIALLSKENHKTLQNVTVIPKTTLTTTTTTTTTTSDSSPTTNGSTIIKQTITDKLDVKSTAENGDTNENGQSVSVQQPIQQQYDVSRIENGDLTKFKPVVPADIAKWLEYNEISSKSLKRISTKKC